MPLKFSLANCVPILKNAFLLCFPKNPPPHFMKNGLPGGQENRPPVPEKVSEIHEK
jgi:hypothetical protein